jgi:hypothetical protein
MLVKLEMGVLGGNWIFSYIYSKCIGILINDQKNTM